MLNKKKIAFMASLILSGAALAACGGTTPIPAPTTTSEETPVTTSEAAPAATSEVVTKYYTFTFEVNGGSAVASQQVEEGKHAVAPEDPTKDGYVFDGWYKEATFATIYDFDVEVVNADTTVYANWLVKSDSNANKATFYYNYDGAPNNGVYEVKEFQDGAKLRKPSTDPTREGYAFAGWYMEATCETAFANNTVYEGDQSIYAQWSKIYTLEAEDTKLTGYEPEEDETINAQGNKVGHGISSDFSGAGCIGNDPSASNGKAVHGIYYYGAYIDFEFTSDKAVEGASLTLRLAAEFRVVTLTSKTFKVQANGSNLSYKYGDITLTPATNSNGDYCGDGYWDTATAHNYTEIMINTFTVKEGENKIRLLVNNDDAMSVGTCQAYAPIVDCIKINSTSNITMTVYDNK